ncbi:Cyclin [Macleaya cordata]|uniref:Cyclin n=1 Tax=Macleaya cordata TaxID=56857 RepID=A0A200R7S4_MACCD|nr:Cyclin [Macleaya cordata]
MTQQPLQDHSSSHGIARNGSDSYNILEGFQGCMPKWYFSKKEIEDHSPSRRDGVDFKKESELRKLYCSFLQDLGMKLKVPQVTIASAMMLCHRFYLRQSHVKNEWQTIATVSMFLACKVEETPRLLKDVVVVAYEIMYGKNPAAAQRIKHKDVYEKQKELILTGERLLLATIAFDLNIQLPYKPLVAALKRMEISHISNIAKVAWNFVNDWLRTTLCLQYKPHYIAAGSMYLAAKFQNMKLPSEKGKVWWMEFDVVPCQLEEVIQKMLGLLKDNKKPKMPSFHDRATQATLVVKKEVSNSTQSPGPSGSVTTTNSNDLHIHNSSSLPHKDTCETRKEALQSQTSDSGSSHSVVEDGDDRSNEGEVLVESNQIASTKIVSVSGGISQIEKDRIREAIKKRKFDRVANKKVVVETDHNEDWIVRELENGLELEYSSAEKRQRQL